MSKNKYTFDEENISDDTSITHSENLMTGDGIAQQIVNAHFEDKYGPAQSSLNEFFMVEPDSLRELDALRKQRQKEIEILAKQTFSNSNEAYRWFNTPLPIALKNKTPFSVMTTIDGCDKVEKILRELYS